MRKRGRLLLGMVCVFMMMFAFATVAMAATTSYGTMQVTGTNLGDPATPYSFIVRPDDTVDLYIGSSSRSVTFEFTPTSNNIEMYYGSSTKAITKQTLTVSNGNTYTFKFKDLTDNSQNILLVRVHYANTDIDKLYLYDDSGNELTYTTSSTNVYKLRNKLAADVKSITLNVLPKYDGAEIYIDGVKGNSKKIDLADATTSVTIRVSLPTSGGLPSASVSYILLVDRASSTASSDNTLSSLYVTEGTLSPAFRSSTTTYTCAVPSNTSSVAIYTTASEELSTIKVYQEGDLVANTNKISLASGGNEFRIVVTAPNFSTKTYKLTVNRGGGGGGTIPSASSNAYLYDLSVDPSTGSAKWDDDFSKTTTSYNITIPETATYVRVMPDASSSAAVIEVAGEEVDSGDYSSKITISEGSSKTVKVVVTAGDGDTTKTYTLRITREGKTTPDVKPEEGATISTLILKDSADNIISVSPSFNKGITSYTALVKNSVTGVKVKALPTDSSSKMTVNGVALTSNTDSGVMQLIVGTSAINITVTDSKGNKEIYSIKVTRTAADGSDIAIKMKLNSTTFTKNGVTDKMDAAPYLSQNRTMVPLRFVSQAFGVGEKDIKWDQKTKTATIIYEGKTLRLTVGKADPANGLDVGPEVKYNRTMVPLRYISTQFGCKTDWNQTTKEITITRK